MLHEAESSLPARLPLAIRYVFQSADVAARFGAATGHRVVAGKPVAYYTASNATEANLFLQSCAAFEAAER